MSNIEYYGWSVCKSSQLIFQIILYEFISIEYKIFDTYTNNLIVFWGNNNNIMLLWIININVNINIKRNYSFTYCILKYFKIKLAGLFSIFYYFEILLVDEKT